MSYSWTRPPQHPWTIDEIKHGNIITTYSLNGIIQSQNSKNSFPSITFGRIADDPSIVDIVTAHESCSRQHARIAFDCRGTPWLRDLGSANGTFVNEKRLPPEACGKFNDSNACNQKGSRGVVLFPGDAIRFGASTRLYILEGPEEFERGALKHGEAAIHHHDDSISPEPTENSAGCSWGMAADDVPPADTEHGIRNSTDMPPLPSLDSFFFSSSAKIQIPNNLRQLHSKYNTKMHKLQSIQTESQRIIQKENIGVELTDGQRSQLGKNEERINTLEKDVATLKEKIEDGMFSVLYGKERGRKRPREDSHQTEDEGVDCFYDRTASDTSKRRGKENVVAVESEASLIQKWKSLLHRHAKQQQLAVRALDRCTGLQKLIDDAAEDSDDLFFLKNDLTLGKENLSKANKSAEEMVKELDECEFLLKTINDKLVWDRSEGSIGTNIVMKGETTVKVDSGVRHSSPPNAIRRLSCSVEKVAIEDGKSSNELSNASELQKTKTMIGPSRLPAQGTLSALRQASSVPRSSKTRLHTNESEVLNPVETQKDEWIAPMDQDGSGRTALNVKFMGRY
jgi:hypothetical protein